MTIEDGTRLELVERLTSYVQFTSKAVILFGRSEVVKMTPGYRTG